MITFGALLADHNRLAELGNDDVLIAAGSAKEVVVRDAARAPQATMIFQREKIAALQNERVGDLEKLKSQLASSSLVVPIRQRPGSFWDQITVGRVSTADIAIEDPSVSNVHAHFEVNVDDNSVSLQDLGSSNGTYVNREALLAHKPVVLRWGDCVRFGESVFYYVASNILRTLVTGR